MLTKRHAAKGSVLEEKVIEACMDLAFQCVKEGSLFVIELDGASAGYYTKVFHSLIRDDKKKLNVTVESDKPIIKNLAALDGAVILNNRGDMREFGVTLKKQMTFFGHGKRHAFAVGTSRLRGLVCILASEEDKHVRLFREGVCVADVDSRTRVPAKLKHRLVRVLDTPLSKVLVASGITASILTLNPIPAIVTITGSSVIVSYGFDRLKALFK
ncbi:DisA bacterial checkpoint controller nucleotide-binding protein [uncultured archaeon]|nr:DisA bacterial checkpoint controller nucleotide-binding protein [uncultured archaeon]